MHTHTSHAVESLPFISPPAAQILEHKFCSIPLYQICSHWFFYTVPMLMTWNDMKTLELRGFFFSAMVIITHSEPLVNQESSENCYQMSCCATLWFSERLKEGCSRINWTAWNRISCQMLFIFSLVLVLKINSTLKNTEYVYAEMFAMCLEILVLICLLVLHLCYSCEKIGIVCCGRGHC